MRNLAVGLACTFLLSSTARPADAGPVLSLHGTGLDASGSLLPDGSADPHYALIGSPAGSGLGPATYVTDSSRFPLSTGNWLANDPVSRWISPTADQSTFLDSVNSGDFTYRTTFDLTGFDPTTASITGRWATDNAGLDILLNGISTGITHTDANGLASFQYFSAFTISDGFRNGINTLDFVVRNAPLGYQGGLYNPSGLRTELSLSAAAVPEPSTLAMGLVGASGAAAVAWLRRRKRSPER